MAKGPAKGTAGYAAGTGMGGIAALLWWYRPKPVDANVSYVKGEETFVPPPELASTWTSERQKADWAMTELVKKYPGARDIHLTIGNNVEATFEYPVVSP